MLLHDTRVIYGKSKNELVNANIEFALLHIACLKKHFKNV